MFISCDSIPVPCMVCVSVPFTELHEHAYTIIAFVLVPTCIVYQQSMKILFAFYCSTKINFVHVSLSISELHEHAYSHCSLLWCEKGIVYQQVNGVLVSYH